MGKFLIYLILAYIAYRLLRSLFNKLFEAQRNPSVRGNTQKHNKKFKNNDIEDADYEEID